MEFPHSSTSSFQLQCVYNMDRFQACSTITNIILHSRFSENDCHLKEILNTSRTVTIIMAV